MTNPDLPLYTASASKFVTTLAYMSSVGVLIRLLRPFTK